jgi:uncharacterized protein (DUF433 family)
MASTCSRSGEFEAGIRAVLSLKETTILADISEDRLRKDIETGLLCPGRLASPNADLRPASLRPYFHWPDVFFLAAIYRSDLLARSARGKVYRQLVEKLLEPNYKHHYNVFVCTPNEHAQIWDAPSHLLAKCELMTIDDTLSINCRKLFGDLTPRVDLYARGLSRTEEKPGVLGGEAVFRNTRLSVRHIGKMSANGEPTEEIRLDYPYLSEDDVKFARLYYEAHPIVGRPRVGVATYHAKIDHR